MAVIMKAKAPILAILLILALLMPPEIGGSVSGLHLNPYRLFLMLVLIPLLIKLFSGKVGAFNKIDFFVILHCLWVFISLSVNHDIPFAIETGGIYIVECLGAYLIGRCVVTTVHSYKIVLKTLFISLLFIMFFVLIETFIGINFIREVSSSIFGGSFNNVMEKRLGLVRAYGSFNHPILLGVFSAGVFSMLYMYGLSTYQSKLKRILPGFVATIVTLTSISSGAFAPLFIQYFMLGWQKLAKKVRIKSPWTLFWSLLVAFYILIDIFSNRSPVKVFLTYMTFSAHTAYNRLNIWEYGSDEVVRHPIFGIGLEDWIRPDWMHSGSMDNFWLVNAVRYGVPAFLFLLVAVIYVLYSIRKVSAPSEEYFLLRQGYMYSIIAIVIAATTVHLWNQIFVYFMFLVGLGHVFLSRDVKKQRVE